LDEQAREKLTRADQKRSELAELEQHLCRSGRVLVRVAVAHASVQSSATRSRDGRARMSVGSAVHALMSGSDGGWSSERAPALSLCRNMKRQCVEGSAGRVTHAE